MKKTIGDLIEERAGLVEEQRALLDAAESRGSATLSGGERRKYDQLDTKIRSIGMQIDAEQAAGGGARSGPRPEGSVGDAAEADGVLTRDHRLADFIARHRPGLIEDDAFGDEPHSRRQFSLGRLVRGMATGRWEGAELEQRALAEGADATGGALVPTFLSANVIDLVRNEARVLQAGAMTIPMDSEKHKIARLKAGVTGAWREENEAVSQEAPEFEGVEFKAKSLAVLVRCSFELLEDAIDGGASITDDVTKALALELDRVALRGTGTDPEPKGVLHQTGVAIESLGANGAKLENYVPFVKAAGTVRQANIEPNAFIYSARTEESLGELVDTLGQPLRQPRTIENVEHLVSNQVPDDVEHGESKASSEIYTGDWHQLLFGVRPTLGIRVRILQERFADEMQVGILAYLRADVQLAHPEAFKVTTGVLS